MSHRILSLIVVMAMLLTALPVFAEAANGKTEHSLSSTVMENGGDMLKYGHIDVAIPADDFLSVFPLGEEVVVNVEGCGVFCVPVCASYDDVAAGEMLLRAVSGKDYVILAINYGQIAAECGLIEKAPEGSETAYVVKDDVRFPIDVTVTGKADVLSSTVMENGGDMLKYGHIDIDIPADIFLANIALGETVIVDLGQYGSFEAPVCASYDDVAAGEMLLRAVSGKDYVILAINYGQIAAECGLIEKAPEGSETAYVVKDGVRFPIDVTIARKVASFSAPVLADGADMLKYGHIDIDFVADEALNLFALGDIVNVDLGDFGSYDVPVCASYDDVAAGEMLLRVVSGKDYVILAINYGQIALECGLIEKAPEGSETAYVVKDESFFPLNAVVTLKASASSSANMLGNLIRTDDRAEYPTLTDAEFANFRMVRVSGIGENKLYRASSPINPEIGRSAYADAAAAEAGIKTFVNLADTDAEAAAYPGYAESYCAAQNHIFLGLPAAFTTDTFTAGLADGLRFMIANEGPWLVHCNEGKDRAGITVAILECLTGASYDEVVEDYVITYRNYYSVENGLQRALTAEEEEAAGNVIISNLSLAFGVKLQPDSDLAAAAENYLTKIGLSADEIESLRALLK